MKRSTYLIIFGLIICAGLIGFINWQNNHRALPQVAVPSMSSSSEPAIVTGPSLEDTEEVATALPVGQAKRQVTLPQDSEFIVSGNTASSGIRFIEGSIKPLDVHVGDTQNFRIVVTSPNGIKRVVAEIETDKGINEVELTREGMISILDTHPNPYVVSPKDNSLQILSDKELAQAREKEYEQELASKHGDKVNAAQGEKEVWTGSWVVKDTHNKNYITTFVAYDSAGNSEKMSLAWSDLCVINLKGNWSTASTVDGCTIDTASTDGVENGNVEIKEGKNLNISNGANFVWNDGKAITIRQGAKITINTGAKLVQAYLYVPDNDNDRHSLPWALGQQIYSVGTSTPSGYNSRNIIIGLDDCCDNNQGAVPGTTIYHSSTFTNQVMTSSPLFGFDWDCNEVVEVNPTYNKECTTTFSITSTPHKLYVLCAGYNTDKCCGEDGGGGGGGGGGCVGPECTQARGYQSRFIKQAQAGEVACCSDVSHSIEGCLFPSTLSSSSCGQTKNIAWQAYYYTCLECCTGATQGYYNYTQDQVGCK
jgi:hypothetical protein